MTVQEVLTYLKITEMKSLDETKKLIVGAVKDKKLKLKDARKAVKSLNNDVKKSQGKKPMQP